MKGFDLWWAERFSIDNYGQYTPSQYNATDLSSAYTAGHKEAMEEAYNIADGSGREGKEWIKSRLKELL